MSKEILNEFFRLKIEGLRKFRKDFIAFCAIVFNLFLFYHCFKWMGECQWNLIPKLVLLEVAIFLVSVFILSIIVIAFKRWTVRTWILAKHRVECGFTKKGNEN